MKDELCFICNVHFVLSRRCLQTNLSAVLTRGWRPELGIWKVFVFSQQELDPRIKQHQHGLMWPEKIFDMDEVSSERRLPTWSRQQYFVCEQNGSGLIWSLLSNRDEPSAIIQLFSIDPRPYPTTFSQESGDMEAYLGQKFNFPKRDNGIHQTNAKSSSFCGKLTIIEARREWKAGIKLTIRLLSPILARSGVKCWPEALIYSVDNPSLLSNWGLTFVTRT